MANTNFTAEQQKAIDNYKKNMNLLKEKGEWTTTVSKSGLNELKKLGIGSNANGFFLLDSTPTSNNNTTTNKTSNATSNTTSNISSTTTPKINYTGNSITEYLNKVGIDSSFSNRAKLAKQYGISNYTGTAAQNTQLLNMMRNGQTGVSSSTNKNAGLENQPEGTNHGTNLNEPISYYDNWDYQTDDPNRLEQIRQHIENGYVNTHPQLFTDRGQYEKFFHYGERGEAQQHLLDELWDKYSTSNASPSETKYLSQEKEFEEQKRDDKLATLQDIIDQLNTKWDNIEDKISDNLKNARNNLDNIANTFADRIAEVQKLYDEYYPKVQQAYQEKMAGEMAGLTSEMSSKKMSGLLRNSLYGIQQNYAKLFSNLTKEKASLLDELNKTYGDFMLNLQKERDNLDSNEYAMLSDGYSNLKATFDALSAAQQQSIDEINRARENWYKSRSDEVADIGGNAAKKEAKSAAYRAMNYNQRAQYLNDNLVTIIGDGTTLDNYNYNVIKYAAENYDDLTQALHYIAQNAKIQNKTSDSSSSSTKSTTDSGFLSLWNSAGSDVKKSTYNNYFA